MSILETERSFIKPMNPTVCVGQEYVATKTSGRGEDRSVEGMYEVVSIGPNIHLKPKNVESFWRSPRELLVDIESFIRRGCSASGRLRFDPVQR